MRIPHREVEVACDPANGEAARRLTAWQELRAVYGTGVEVVEGGVRLWLQPDGARDAVVLARAEASCCAFLDIEVAIEHDGVRIELTSPTPEGAAVARILAGIDGQHSCSRTRHG